MTNWPNPEVPTPDIEEVVMNAENGGCTTSCADECWVELDGSCEHGHPSWLIRWGLI